jgi:hypothetical protein
VDRPDRAARRKKPPRMKTIEPRRQRYRIPWLVGISDLQRYLGRAVHQCARGRCIFFYATVRVGRDRGQRLLFILAPVRDGEEILTAGKLDYWGGRFRKVKLADMPPLRRRRFL